MAALKGDIECDVIKFTLSFILDHSLGTFRNSLNTLILLEKI
jgi:hypothetical protein